MFILLSLGSSIGQGDYGPKLRAPRFYRHNKQSHVDERKIIMYKLIKLITKIITIKL